MHSSQRIPLMWFDKKAKALVRCKQRLYNRAKASDNPDDRAEYKLIKNQTNHNMKISEKSY